CSACSWRRWWTSWLCTERSSRLALRSPHSAAEKMGADLLGSVQAKVQRALDVTRESFPCELQFNPHALHRDQTQTPNLKVKVAILRYIQALTALMDRFIQQQRDQAGRVAHHHLDRSQERRRTQDGFVEHIQFFSSWSGEELRPSLISALPGETQLEDRCKQAAQVVLISLFELNTPEFSMLLGALPKTFQDGTTKLLHHHLKSATSGLARYCSLPQTQTCPGRSSLQRGTGRGSPLMSPTNHSVMFDVDPEASEEVCGSKSPDDETRANRETLFSLGVSWDSSGLGDTADAPPPRALIGPRFKDYNPQNYSDNERPDQGQDNASPSEQVELVGSLLKSLSQAEAGDLGLEQRKHSLLELLKVSRDESVSVWDEHFKTTLLLLLETLNDAENSIRALSLRVMKEILKNQPQRFKNYAELTIMKTLETLEAHEDSHKEVVRAAEETALALASLSEQQKKRPWRWPRLSSQSSVVRAAEETALALASSLVPEQCLKVLCPIVQTADFPVNMAAIKMQTKAVDRISREPLLLLLPDLIPGLLQGYDNTESSVRKASVFCLVSIYSVIGEDLKPFLSQLTGSKMKLLNLYIKRAQTTASNSSSSSDISSY
ncbi:hypothetical protein WMY93_032545, partial [Mugilogobius chulae]